MALLGDFGASEASDCVTVVELREIDSGDQSAVIGYQGQLLSGEPGHQPTKMGLGQGDRLCLGAGRIAIKRKDGSCMEN